MREECLYKDICQNECTESCIRFLEMDYLLKYSGIPKSKQKIHKLVPENKDMDAFIELADIRDDIYNFVQSGKCLYIYSDNCGNGKTTWSIKMLLQYFNEVWAGNGFKARGLFINIPDFISCSKEFNNPQSSQKIEYIKNNISDLDLVVFDDIAATKLSDFDSTNLLTLIDKRVLEEKSMIFTGNVNPSKLSEYVGTRLASRILNGSLIKIKGKDRRL